MKRTAVFLLCLLVFPFSLSAAAESTEISRGATYTLITPASKAYPDDGLKLTDGIYGNKNELTDSYYSSDAYVGFNKADINESGSFAFMIDLGEKYHNITKLSVGYLSEIRAGISAPEKVTFSVSDADIGSFKQIGVIDTTPEDLDKAESYAKSCSAENVSGRYILVTVTPMGFTDKDGTTSIAPWTFIDEIAIFAEDTQSTSESLPEENESAPLQSALPTHDEAEKPDNTPQTGDTGTVLGFTLLLLASVTMVFALFVPKNKKY